MIVCTVQCTTLHAYHGSGESCPLLIALSEAEGGGGEGQAVGGGGHEEEGHHHQGAGGEEGQGVEGGHQESGQNLGESVTLNIFLYKLSK